MSHDNTEARRAARRAAAERGDPELLAEFQRDMDREVERQRAQTDRALAVAHKNPPLTWEAVAAWVSDDVWERILNDMPVSRRDLERIRPSRRPTLPGQTPAA